MRPSAKKTKLTPPELAKLWGVSPAKVVSFIRSGELRAINLATSRRNRPRYAVDIADVDAFEAARAVVPDGGRSTTQRLRQKTKVDVKEYF